MQPDTQPEAAKDTHACIVQLEEDVINRIAAGEVVVRPANALKELIENCLDAGSKQVAVALKAGGLKMLRIEDDGHGIREEDMPILCERFTTSKLRKYSDLNSISTFGFRGEALASISHVAFVTVTTMTSRDSVAHVAQYTEGKLRGPPRPCAGTRGTTIVAEDMFHNNQTRRKALGKDSLEHAKCLDVVQKYSMHYPHVSFVCRKAGSAVAELHTFGGVETTRRQVVGVVQGSTLSSHLFEFSAKSIEPKFECHGLATGPEWTSRNMSLTLFINNRLIECSSLRRAIEAIYLPVLPRHQHPWVYLSVDLDPLTVDVNVHPTKQEVQFLHEETIAAHIQEALHAQLKERAGTRTFDAQSSLLIGTGAGSLSAGGGGSRRVQKIAEQTAPAMATAGPAGSTVPEVSTLVASAGGHCKSVTGGGSEAALVALDTLVMSSSGLTEDTSLHPLPIADEQLTQTGSATQRWKPQQTQRAQENKTRIRTDHRQLSLASILRKSSSETHGLQDSSGAIDLSQDKAEPAQHQEVQPAQAPPQMAAPEAQAEAQSEAQRPQDQQDPQGDSPMPPAAASAAAAPRTPRSGRPSPSTPRAARLALAFGEDEASRKAAFDEAQQLTSISELRAASALASDKELTLSLNQSVYVGPVSRELALLQCGPALCLVNIAILAREFSYQRVLRLFGGPGRTLLREPLSLEATLRLGIQDPGSGYDPVEHADVDVAKLAGQFASLLTERAQMLHEYLMLDIEQGMIKGLPNALGIAGDVSQKFDELPLFLVRLCADVSWEDEKLCFENLCRTVADFCVEQVLPCPEDAERCMAACAGSGSAGPADANALNAAVEAGEFPDVVTAAQAARAKRMRTVGPNALQELRLLHEAIRNDAASAGSEQACRWPRSFKKDGTVTNLVALEQLYRVFERC